MLLESYKIVLLLLACDVDPTHVLPFIFLLVHFLLYYHPRRHCFVFLGTRRTSYTFNCLYRML